MVKKLVGVGLASVLAVGLWSGIPPASRRVLASIKKLEATYHQELRADGVEMPETTITLVGGVERAK